MGAERGITGLVDMVAALPATDRERFERIFHVDASVGRLSVPPAMLEWVEEAFGSVDAATEQKIVSVTNLVTMEGALFNELRAKRPVVREKAQELEALIQQERGGSFCKPLERTPEDVFGRIKGKHSVTASNIAKFDGFAGVVIFNEHNPLDFTREQIADYIDTGMAWLKKAHETDPRARYPFWLWNCLWRAGASIVHGHAQVILAKDRHYAKVEGLRRAALAYRKTNGHSYFDDLFEAHKSLGLGVEVEGTRILVYLAPIKDKEVLILSSTLDEGLKRAIYQVLDCYVRHLHVSSFNVAILMPPLAPTEEDWSGFPYVVRIVDRGDPFNRTMDVAAMELYASSVIFSDPFEVMEVLRASLPD